jgi:hypothetical protein
MTDYRQRMSDYLPRYYDDSRIVGNLLDQESAEVSDLNAAIADVLAQFFVDTATWGLANWERICGIKTDETKPYDQRRSAIKARLRGVGTVTVALIKNVAESYNNGEVEVTEDNANYTIAVRFVSTYGRPSNMTDIQNALREIVPAHLAIDFVFTYATWSEVDSRGQTWADIDALGETWAQYEAYQP